MFTMIVISSAALLIGIIGCALIWGFDALRADEIERAAVPAQARTSLPSAKRASGA